LAELAGSLAMKKFLITLSCLVLALPRSIRAPSRRRTGPRTPGRSLAIGPRPSDIAPRATLRARRIRVTDQPSGRLIRAIVRPPDSIPAPPVLAAGRRTGSLSGVGP
jgi:hypothetical protein